MLLVLLMMASLVPASRAADTDPQEAAAALYKLGLFLGTGTDANGKPIFELGRIMNRNEAVTMLVRQVWDYDDGYDWDYEYNDDYDPWSDPGDYADPGLLRRRGLGRLLRISAR